MQGVLYRFYAVCKGRWGDFRGILWKFCGNKTLLAVLLVNIWQESGANRVRIGLATRPRTPPFTLLFGYPPYPRLFFPQ